MKLDLLIVLVLVFGWLVVQKLTEISRRLKRILKLVEKLSEGESRSPSTIIFSFNGMKMETPMQMKDSDKAAIAISEVDDSLGFKIDGAKLDDGALFSLDDASMGSLAVAADGQSAVFTPAKPGLVHVNLSASINGKAIAGVSEDIVVTPGDAASVKLGVSLAQ